MPAVVAGIGFFLGLFAVCRVAVADCGSRAPEFSADEDTVAGTGAGAQHRFAFRHGANHDDVGEDSVRGLGRITSGESHSELFRQPDQAPGEASRPRIGVSL